MKLNQFYVWALGAMLFACTGSQKETTSETEESEIVEVNVKGTVTEYATDSTNMVGYLTMDVNDSSKRPGILVFHEWWGHDDHARERADMLAELGYVALAVDMYGDGKQASHPGEASEFSGMLMGNIDEARSRFDAALATLKSQPYVDPEKIGAIGFCFGGSVVLSMANAGYDLDAVAAFHAGIQLPIMPDSGAVKAKVLVANGSADPMVTEQHVTDFKSVMDAAGVDYTYLSYDDVLHAFTNKKADSLAKEFNLPLAYDAAADSASWEEMKVLFARSF